MTAPISSFRVRPTGLGDADGEAAADGVGCGVGLDTWAADEAEQETSSVQVAIRAGIRATARPGEDNFAIGMCNLLNVWETSKFRATAGPLHLIKKTRARRRLSQGRRRARIRPNGVAVPPADVRCDARFLFQRDIDARAALSVASSSACSASLT